MSFDAPAAFTKSVPVTAKTPVAQLKEAEVILGTATLETTIPFPETSATSTAELAPAIQSSAAATLYVIPSVADNPFLFRIRLASALSAIARIIVKEVRLVISTFAVLVS